MLSVEILYIIFSATLIATGLVMAGMAIQAYAETTKRSMIFLSVGFTLIVAAATMTTISAFVNNFSNPRLLLTVNYFVTTIGFFAVIVSLYAD